MGMWARRWWRMDGWLPLTRCRRILALCSILRIDGKLPGIVPMPGVASRHQSPASFFSPILVPPSPILLTLLRSVRSIGGYKGGKMGIERNPPHRSFRTFPHPKNQAERQNILRAHTVGSRNRADGGGKKGVR